MEPRPTTSPADYQRHLAPLLQSAAGLALAILRNRADAEDAIQEAAMKGLRALPSYDANRSFKSWWLSILRNCCRDILRQRISTSHPVPLPDLDLPDHRPADVEPWESLAHALSRLSTSHRQILELRYFAECSYHEIAETLEIPEGTVMSRLHAARKALAFAYHQEEA